jgi:hypothetical protein
MARTAPRTAHNSVVPKTLCIGRKIHPTPTTPKPKLVHLTQEVIIPSTQPGKLPRVHRATACGKGAKVTMSTTVADVTCPACVERSHAVPGLASTDGQLAAPALPELAAGLALAAEPTPGPATLDEGATPAVVPDAGERAEQEQAAPVDARVQYLLDLVTQGPAAIAEALQTGLVRVRQTPTKALPRARTYKDTYTAPALLGDDATARVSSRQATFLLGVAATQTWPGGSSQVRKELHRKGLITDDTKEARLTKAGKGVVKTLRATMHSTATLVAD